MEEWMEATVAEAESLGGDYRLIRLQPREAFNIRPGQHVRLRLPLASASRHLDVYVSVASPPGPTLDLCVKAGNSGIPAAFRELSAGATVGLAGPGGSFALPADSRRAVLIAGGSGIGPLRAILLSQLKRLDHVTLIHGGRTPDETPFADEFVRLAADTHLNLVLVAESDCRAPFVSGRVPDHLAPWIAQDTDYLLCGPPPMVAAARALLLKGGVAAERILQDCP